MKRIKEQYKGLIITRNNMLVGNITFDSTKVRQEEYENFIKLGFEDLFEDYEENIPILLKEESTLNTILYNGTEEPNKTNKRKKSQ